MFCCLCLLSFLIIAEIENSLRILQNCKMTKVMKICDRWIRVVSPRKVSRFAPLNRYYIIIDEVFFDNFLEIIYLLVVCKKNNNSFILVYFCQRSQEKLFLQNLQKQHTRTVKRLGFFCTNAKVHEMTKMLYKCANNLFFKELRIKC